MCPCRSCKSIHSCRQGIIHVEISSEILFFCFKAAYSYCHQFCPVSYDTSTHSLSKKIKDNDNVSVREPRIIAEYIKPPQKDENREHKPRIRQIKASASNQFSQKPISLKFVPDLAVEQGSTDEVAMSSGELEAVIFEEGEVDQMLNR